MNAEKFYDTEKFEYARDILNKRFYMILENYLKDSRLYIANIEVGLKEENMSQVASNAHPLKSSSAGLGITSIEEIAREIEFGAKNFKHQREIEHLKNQVLKIQEIFDKITPELQILITNNANNNESGD